MRSLSYDGSMVFQKLNDETIRTNYQHKHVVDNYIAYFNNKTVLDAGCWTGTIEKEVRSRKLPCEIVGIDLNKDALEVAKKNFPGLKFYQENLADPHKDFMRKYKGYFDTVVFLDVLEHIPIGSEVAVLKVLRNLLKPDGVVVLSTMLDHPFNFIDPAWFFGHRHYRVEQVHTFYTKAGFLSYKTSLLGNLFWDIDLLLLYTYKHLFKKEYITPRFIFLRILKGLRAPQKFATRIYSLVKKSS